MQLKTPPGFRVTTESQLIVERHSGSCSDPLPGNEDVDSSPVEEQILVPREVTLIFVVYDAEQFCFC